MNNVSELTNNELTNEFIINVLPYETFKNTASLSVTFEGDTKNKSDLELYMSKFSIDMESSEILIQYFIDIQQISEDLKVRQNFSKEIESYILNSELKECENIYSK